MNADRRLALALRAFPKRFRAARADEIMGTVAEVRAAGGGDGVGRRELVDLVLAGWAERWRTRPPMRTMLRYRWFEGRLDQRWHAWMFDDLRGWYPLRHWLRSLVGMLVLSLTLQWVVDGVIGNAWGGPGGSAGFFIYVVALASVGGVIEVFRHTNRTRILLRHGYDASTWRPHDAVPVSPRMPLPPPPRALSRAVPVLRGTAIGLALAGPAAAVAMFVPSAVVEIESEAFSISRDTSYVEVVGLAMLVVACLLVASSRWWGGGLRRRFVTDQPWLLTDQQYRERSWWRTLVVAACAVGIPGIATSVLPIAPMFVPAAYLAALGLVPEFLVTARAVERLEAETGRSYWLSRPARAGSMAR
jgi:hypothetical protein